MVERRALKVVASNPAPSKQRRKAGGDYFPDMDKDIQFIPSGCALLDCVLGGGWPLGRIVNIVGDKSTGKTLLAIEACANFDRYYPKGKIYYREAEAAFDISYAKRLGLPVNRVDFGDKGIKTKWNTIEDVFRDLRAQVAWHNSHTKVPGLYIIDSLDALTSEAALKREVGEGSFNLEKPKMLSQMFSELAGEFKAADICVIIISQTRTRIGFVIGEKHRRAGGDSLDFYASQIIWLTHLKTLVHTAGGQKRATGIRILANCKKNKITMPFRRCEFKIRFGYGIEDIEASLEWLAEVKMLDKLGIAKSKLDGYIDGLENLSKEEYNKRSAEIREVVLQSWEEVEARFLPKRQKYG